jgi:hypothetical protein
MGIVSYIHLMDYIISDKQAIFPPTSVKLKKPFAVKPWNGSDENVANLLMVWRFLITFADVLGLWPFTLDEFAQAFHDYVSVSLFFKSIQDLNSMLLLTFPCWSCRTHG